MFVIDLIAFTIVILFFSLFFGLIPFAAWFFTIDSGPILNIASFVFVGSLIWSMVGHALVNEWASIGMKWSALLSGGAA